MASARGRFAVRFAGVASLLVMGAGQLVGACSSSTTTDHASAGDGGGGDAGSNGGASPRAGGGGVFEVAGDPNTAAGASDDADEGGSAGIAEAGTGGAADAGAGGEGGARCVATTQVLAQADKAWGLTLDNGYVYWTTRKAGGKVLREPVAGGAIETLASGEQYPYEVAVAAGHAFWAELGAQPGHLFQASVTGADRKQIATGEFSGIYGLNADANNVYYVTNLNDVVKVPVNGGDALKISKGPLDSIIVDMTLVGSTLFWTNNGIGMFESTVEESAGVLGINVSGATASAPLVNLINYPQFEVAADNTAVYWNDQSAIYRTLKIGGKFTKVTALPEAPSSESPIVDLASDGTHLFYSDGHSLFRVAATGGTPELFATGWDRIVKVAVDDDSVYFTDYVQGIVVKVPKCAPTLVPISGSGGAGGVGGSSSTAGSGGSSAAGAGGSGGTAGVAGTGGSLGAAGATNVVTVAHPWGLAVDDQYVYYSTFQPSGAIARVPLAGGAPQSIATAQPSPSDISVDGTNIYWCLDNTPFGHLVQAPKAGGTIVPLADGDGVAGVHRVTTDASFAYYVSSFNAVWRVAIGGGTPVYVAAGPYGSTVSDLAINDGEAFWTNDGTFNSTFSAKLPGTAYVARAPNTGTSTLGHTSLVTGLNSPLARIAVDSAHVFAVDGSKVYRGERSGGGLTPIAALPAISGAVYDMLSDGVNLYFIDAHTVYRVAVTGGSVEPLSSGWGTLRAVAADGANVYFTDYSGGAVLKRPK